MLAVAHHRLRTALVVAMLAGTTIAACGGSSNSGGVLDQTDDVNDVYDIDDGDDIVDGDGGGADAIGLGDTDAPVVVTIDGVSLGYRDGSCRVDDEIVRFRVVPDAGVLHGHSSMLTNSVDITWHPELAHLPFHAQHAVFLLDSTIQAEPAPFSLRGGAHTTSAAASRWDATVSGTTVEFDLTLVESMLPGNEPQTKDVHITARCDSPILGGGPPLGASPVGDGGGSVDPQAVLMQMFDGHIEVTFQGATHNIGYITYCTINSQDVMVSGSNNDLSIQLGYNQVDIELGDPRSQDRPRFTLPETIQIPYEGTSTRSWSGTLVDEQGNEEPVAVAVTCNT